MNVTIPMLLVSTVVMSVVATAQTTNPPKVGKRVPVGVSVEGPGEAARRAPDGTTRGDRVGLSARRTTGGLDTRFDCLESIADQATGSCLTASSTPTLGMLYPYPGLNNVFVPRAFVGGGEDNQAMLHWSTVGGGRNNIASGAGYYGGYATVAGGGFNTASGNEATIGGGKHNTASGGFYGGATVAGGRGNTASAARATVAGGSYNSALANGATIGGGYANAASASSATVAGGALNTAAGSNAAVGGGKNNSATVYGAMIPGGGRNTASGITSFAAGRSAKANHDGAFVWADSEPFVDKPSSAADEFSVYCRGGARFFSDGAAATTGVLLAPGGSTWTMVSDRDAKENVEPVDAQAILDKVAELPVATWNYKAQDESIRHMGPMAQDFYAAFGLGLGEKTIDTIDPNGVALAAIQGLNELVRDENANLKERLAEKDAQIEALLARLERLEALVHD